MKISQRNRFIGVFFLAAAGLAVGGPAILLEKKGGIPPSAYQEPNPPPMKFTETQLAAINACRNPVNPAFPTPATQPAGKEVPVVIYHRLTNDEEPSPTVIHPKRFRQQMEALKADGYTTVSAAEVTAYVTGQGVMPEKPVLVTFDDGWKDNETAIKVLTRLNMKATFYIIAGFFETPQYFSKKDVQEIAANPLFEIGSHTYSHFIKFEQNMDKLDLCTVAQELVASKQILEEAIGKPVPSLAWPYGHNTPQYVELAKQFGYTSTLHVNRDAHNAPGNSPHFIRRMNIDGKCSVEDFRQMVASRELKECS